MVRRDALEMVVGGTAGIAGLLVAASMLFQSTTNGSCVQGVCTTTSGPAITLTSPVNGRVALLGVSLAPLVVSGGAIWQSRTAALGGADLPVDRDGAHLALSYGRSAVWVSARARAGVGCPGAPHHDPLICGRATSGRREPVVSNAPVRRCRSGARSGWRMT